MSKPLIVCGLQKPQITSSMLVMEKPLFLQNKNRIGSSTSTAGLGFPFQIKKSSPHFRNIRMPRNNGQIKAIATTLPIYISSSTTVKTVVTILKKTGEIPKTFENENENENEIENENEDEISSHSTKFHCKKHLNLELASDRLDSSTGKEKPTITGEATLTSETSIEEIYEASFEIPSDFGEIGAVIVENNDRKEKYVKEIVLHGFSTGPITVNPNSWVEPSTKHSPKRVFFTNKSYLPSQTPGGLRKMRKEELEHLRGDGKGQRQKSDRIYDYDVYNDLGNANDEALTRPVLGGSEHPYPRRCRTGRPHYPSHPEFEERPGFFDSIYVPRDESFSDEKQEAFTKKKILGFLHTLIPKIEEQFRKKYDFPNFNAIDELYGVDWLDLSLTNQGLELIVRFDPPEAMSRNKFFWLSDEEFARQTLAGLNPLSIQLVTEWPLKSSLNPDIYGPQESAITSAIVDKEIGGSMTVEEAIKQKKVFILDYHDALLPYVEKVRDLKDRTLYGSRTLFFLNPDDTLRPLVIELTRPPMHGKPQLKQVFTPSTHATNLWLWRLAKAHVLVHDSGYHQLINHWLRTHCAVEPYVLATHRQLSAMHPIYRLLHPHLRYTLEINASARSSLVNAGGVIESTFAPGEYSMEFSSDIYKQQWRFDTQALPVDLINRGMAIEDPTQTHGVKLTIKDYPFASDGLILWDALKQWVTEYVNHYYHDPYLIQNDEELQAWWTEIRTVGHGDKQEEAWWPNLNTPKDLIDIITNIVWVASAHHAAVNFGQYAYSGYFPNRPSITRTNMPTEDYNTQDWKEFKKNPEKTLLKCFPTQVQATTAMFVMDLLSTHDPDEEYLGNNPEPSWVENHAINKAFETFSKKMSDLENVIDHRNEDSTMKNRNGAGILPYELLKPSSNPGVTGKGIPYSISI